MTHGNLTFNATCICNVICSRLLGVTSATFGIPSADGIADPVTRVNSIAQFCGDSNIITDVIIKIKHIKVQHCSEQIYTMPHRVWCLIPSTPTCSPPLQYRRDISQWGHCCRGRMHKHSLPREMLRAQSTSGWASRLYTAYQDCVELQPGSFFW